MRPSCLVFRHECPPFLRQRRLQGASRSRQERFDGLIRDTQCLADLDLAHALVVEQGEGEALPLGQTLEGGIDTAGKLAFGEMAQLPGRLAFLWYRIGDRRVATGARPIDA